MAAFLGWVPARCGARDVALCFGASARACREPYSGEGKEAYRHKGYAYRCPTGGGGGPGTGADPAAWRAAAAAAAAPGSAAGSGLLDFGGFCDFVGRLGVLCATGAVGRSATDVRGALATASGPSGGGAATATAGPVGPGLGAAAGALGGAGTRDRGGLPLASGGAADIVATLRGATLKGRRQPSTTAGSQCQSSAALVSVDAGAISADGRGPADYTAAVSTFESGGETPGWGGGGAIPLPPCHGGTLLRDGATDGCETRPKPPATWGVDGMVPGMHPDLEESLCWRTGAGRGGGAWMNDTDPDVPGAPGHGRRAGGHEAAADAADAAAAARRTASRALVPPPPPAHLNRGAVHAGLAAAAAKALVGDAAAAAARELLRLGGAAADAEPGRATWAAFLRHGRLAARARAGLDDEEKTPSAGGARGPSLSCCRATGPAMGPGGAVASTTARRPATATVAPAPAGGGRPSWGAAARTGAAMGGLDARERAAARADAGRWISAASLKMARRAPPAAALAEGRGEWHPLGDAPAPAAVAEVVARAARGDV